MDIFTTKVGDQGLAHSRPAVVRRIDTTTDNTYLRVEFLDERSDGALCTVHLSQWIGVSK